MFHLSGKFIIRKWLYAAWERGKHVFWC